MDERSAELLDMIVSVYDRSTVRISGYVRNFVCIRIGVVGYWVHGWDTEGLSRYLHELFFTQSS